MPSLSVPVLCCRGRIEARIAARGPRRQHGRGHAVARARGVPPRRRRRRPGRRPPRQLGRRPRAAAWPAPGRHPRAVPLHQEGVAHQGHARAAPQQDVPEDADAVLQGLLQGFPQDAEQGTLAPRGHCHRHCHRHRRATSIVQTGEAGRQVQSASTSTNAGNLVSDFKFTTFQILTTHFAPGMVLTSLSSVIQYQLYSVILILILTISTFVLIKCAS